MVAGNAEIMKNIATEVKKSGFDGITVIASNPVDVITHVYQKVTGFDPHKVIGSGTTLDSARLRRLVGQKLNVKPESVQAYVAGEHGDSSVAIWSQANIMGRPILDYVKCGCLTLEEKIVNAVLRDEKSTLMVGAQLNGEYKNKGLYTGVPAIIGSNGWERIIEWDLTKEEQEKFDKSCETLHKTIDSVKHLFE
ncbi:L-lactate dehydrogenase [Mycoplasma mycoides subsp. capri]|nr:L-lactate dehydrogenase [Mycoplasma mycoides subsp. capri]